MTPFDELFETLPTHGWLTKDEGQLLYETAQKASGPILEVGCYHGRSSVLLASLGRIVYCVDPFDGFSTEDPTGAMTRAAWIQNLQPYGNAMLFVQKIEDWQCRPVGMAYLDGDHTYEGTRHQIAAAQLCGAKSIAIHDVSNSGGGIPISKAAWEMLGRWSDKVGTLGVWRDLP